VWPGGELSPWAQKIVEATLTLDPANNDVCRLLV